MFRGLTNSIDEFAIGIDEVKISTSNCEVYPVFSSPGETVSEKRPSKICTTVNCCYREVKEVLLQTSLV